MRTATGIVLLSMVNPVDIAEQMATLDVLTDGRAVFGVGLGYSAHEFDAFGVEPGTRVARFEESLRIVRAMWSGERSTFEGRFHSVARTPGPSVRPLQHGGPPVWVGGQARGCGQARRPDGRRLVRAAVPHACRARVPAPAVPRHPSRRGTPDGRRLPGPPRAAHRAVARRPASRRRCSGTARATRCTGSGGCRARTPRCSRGDEVRADIEDRFVMGSPAECADALGALEAELGMTDFVFKPHWPGLPHARGDGPARDVRHRGRPELLATAHEARGRAGRRRHRGGERDRAWAGRGFLRRGLAVVAADVEATALDQAVARWLRPAESSDRSTDVRDPDALLRLAARTLDELGRVDVVCNNAGIVTPRLPVWEQSPGGLAVDLEVNLLGVVNGIRAFVPAPHPAGRAGTSSTPPRSPVSHRSPAAATARTPPRSTPSWGSRRPSSRSWPPSA